MYFCQLPHALKRSTLKQSRPYSPSYTLHWFFQYHGIFLVPVQNRQTRQPGPSPRKRWCPSRWPRVSWWQPPPQPGHYRSCPVTPASGSHSARSLSCPPSCQTVQQAAPISLAWKKMLAFNHLLVYFNTIKAVPVTLKHIGFFFNKLTRIPNEFLSEGQFSLMFCFFQPVPSFVYVWN